MWWCEIRQILVDLSWNAPAAFTLVVVVVVGGGDQNDHTKLIGIKRFGRSVWFLGMSTLESASVIFSAQVKIKVTRSQQRSNLAKCHIIFPEMCHYLRTYYR